MTAPRLLDAFSGAGGAGRGYQMAGFHVTGIDINPQPRYAGDAFIQGDALDYIAKHGHEYDAIHASPPCQTHVKGMAAVNAKLGRPQKHLDLIPATRAALVKLNLPYVIENVEGASLQTVIRLCGSSFGLPIRRHRLFESSHLLMALPCRHQDQREPKFWTSWRPNGQVRRSTVVQVYGSAAETHLWPAAMGIDWMTTSELSQAIPPAYTKFIGVQLMRAIEQPAPDPPSVVPPGGEPRADLGRAVSPPYAAYRCGKTMSPTALLNAVRRRHPGATIHCHESFIQEVGPADDLVILNLLQPRELFVKKNGATR